MKEDHFYNEKEINIKSCQVLNVALNPKVQIPKIFRYLNDSYSVRLYFFLLKNKTGRSSKPLMTQSIQSF